MAALDDLTDETKDALEMMGLPMVQFEPPGKQIISTENGFKTVTTQGWIKFAIAFRNILPKLKGARLSVFMAICLHVNEEGEAWPSLDTLMAETGYQRAAVVEAIRHLKEVGLVDVDKETRRSSTYKPMYAAYGTSSEIKLPPVRFSNRAVRKSNRAVAKSEPEVEPLSKTKEVETLTEPPSVNPPAITSKHPAIQIIRNLTKRYPPAGLYEMIVKQLGETPDAEKLKACYIAWCSRGYNPTALVWALEWYKVGIPKSGPGKPTISWTKPGPANGGWNVKPKAAQP